jgi:hypothetical protein
MKNVARDQKTGRFVSTKEAGNKIMKIVEAKPKAEKPEAEKPELEVTVADAKPKKTSKVEKKEKKEKPAARVIEILEANYGISGNMVTVTENVKLGKKASNKMAGTDPAPKQKKVMIVKALVEGVEIEKEFNEGEVVAF